MEYFRSSLQRREDITACHILMRFRVRPGLIQKQILMVGRYQVKVVEVLLVLVAERIEHSLIRKFHHTSTRLRAFRVVSINVSIHVWNYIDMYVCIYVFMQVCVYVCIYVCMYVFVYVRMYVCMQVCMCLCMYVYVYDQMYVCTNLCM